MIEFIDHRYEISDVPDFTACYSLVLSYLRNFDRELALSRGIPPATDENAWADS